MWVYSLVRAPLSRWNDRRRSTAGGQFELHHRRIFILPTRAGLVYWGTVGLLWLGSVNYSNSLGFMLTFLLGGLGAVMILHTYRNLSGLQVKPGYPEPVYAGGHAVFPVRLRNPEGRYKTGVVVDNGTDNGAVHGDVPAAGITDLTLRVPAPRRGVLAPGRFRVSTTFPGGLFRAWSWVRTVRSCVVYPRPEAGTVPAPESVVVKEPGRVGGSGDEDFQGLRRYRPGDSPRRVAWRAVARGRPLQTKAFSGEGPGPMWLEWDATAGLGTEVRLSRLCRWILDADTAGRPYGLRLPGLAIAPATGVGHRRRCLEALARFDG